MTDLTNGLVWHDILASVMRQYCGRTLPEELVVPLPEGQSDQTLVVCVRQDGLHITLVSNTKARQLMSLAEAQVSGSVN